VSDWVISVIKHQNFKGLALELDRRQVTYFYPRCRVRRVRNFRYVTQVIPILPSYLFIYTPKYWYHLLDAPGLLTFIMREGRPYRSISLDQTIKRERSRLDADGLSAVPDAMRIKERLSKFIIGDRVRIVDGVFSGVSGEVQHAKAGSITVATGYARLKTSEDNVILEPPEMAVDYALKKRRRRHYSRNPSKRLPTAAHTAA
jgi:transcription antitermination factor NusG